MLRPMQCYAIQQRDKPVVYLRGVSKIELVQIDLVDWDKVHPEQ